MIDMHAHWRPAELADALRARTREPRILRNQEGVEVLKSPRMSEEPVAKAFDDVNFHLASEWTPSCRAQNTNIHCHEIIQLHTEHTTNGPEVRSRGVAASRASIDHCRTYSFCWGRVPAAGSLRTVVCRSERPAFRSIN